MDPLLQFMLALAIIVVAAKGSGYLSTRLGQPAVLGELLVGLILGPTVLDILHWPVFGDEHLGETLSHLAHLGVLFLMFMAGLEVDLEAMMRAGRPAVLAGVMGVVAPVALGIATALPFGFALQRSLFMGLVLAATSVRDEATVERVITATERIIGDFTRPHDGLLFVVPVTRVLGLEKPGGEKPRHLSK